MISQPMKRESGWIQLKRLALVAMTFDISRWSLAMPKPGWNRKLDTRGCKEIAFALRAFASRIDVESRLPDSCGSICSKKVKTFKDSLGPGGRGSHINQRQQQFSTMSRRQMEIMDDCMHTGYYCLRCLAYLEVSKVSLIDAAADPLCISQHSRFCQNSPKRTIEATLDSCLCLATLKLYRVSRTDIMIGPNLRNCSNIEICKRLSSRFPGNWHCINETSIKDPVCCCTKAPEIETWCECNAAAKSRNIVACQDLIWPVGKVNPLGASFLSDEMKTVFLQHARTELLGNIEGNLRQGTASSAVPSASAAGSLVSPGAAPGELSQLGDSSIQLLSPTITSDTQPVSLSEVSDTQLTRTELINQPDPNIPSGQGQQQQDDILVKAALDLNQFPTSEAEASSLTSPETRLDDLIRQPKRLATAARMNKAASSRAHHDPSQEVLKTDWRRTIEPIKITPANIDLLNENDLPDFLQTDFSVSDWSKVNDPIVLSDAGKEFWQENRIDDFLQMDFSVLDGSGPSGACQMLNMGSEGICSAKSASAQVEFGKDSHCSNGAEAVVQGQVYNDGEAFEQCPRDITAAAEAQESGDHQLCVDADDLFDPDDYLML